MIFPPKISTRVHLKVLLITISIVLFSCSNSTEPTYNETSTSINYDNADSSLTGDFLSSISAKLSYSSKDIISSSSLVYTEYLSLDDSEFPYAGLPRIVIETDAFQEIKDKENEIPAKMQIYGKDSPESEIMELTIRGRGNSTWNKPKKPYIITFKEKQSLMGMSKAKKWILLANYFDRTLIRNAVAYEIARKTQLKWTPTGKFVEIFLNKKFLGNYYICEKIQINKNRLNVENNAYLLEFDVNYDEENKFKTSIKNLPINIKKPEQPTTEQLHYIQNHINFIESNLYKTDSIWTVQNYIDIQSFADYFIVYELAQNSELKHPKSAFMYMDNKLLKAGPVWDFDWGTFTSTKKGLLNKKSIWYDVLLKNDFFIKKLQESWTLYKEDFKEITTYIDSLAEYLSFSNERNYQLWPITIDTKDFSDRSETFDKAITMIKNAYHSRILELDSIFSNL